MSGTRAGAIERGKQNIFEKKLGAHYEILPKFTSVEKVVTRKFPNQAIHES